jgi:hypothetical protein
VDGVNNTKREFDYTLAGGADRGLGLSVASWMVNFENYLKNIAILLGLLRLAQVAVKARGIRSRCAEIHAC